MSDNGRVAQLAPGWSSVDTGTGHLLAAQGSGVLTLTLNRPEARNAVSLPMLDALAAMLDRAERSQDVRVVVLSGAGGAFCAGGDLRMLVRGESIYGPAGDPAGRLARQKATQRATVVRLHELAKPTVALVQGAAVGAGLGLALACDLRYAGASATLRTGFGRIGLAGDFGCTWFLQRLLGSSRALELLYFSEAVTASRAQELGLVTEVVADADVRGRVMHLAHRLADAPPEALRAMKQHVVRAAGGDCAAGLADCADAEAEWHARLIGGSEHRGAVHALMNRLSAPHESGDANRDQS